MENTAFMALEVPNTDVAFVDTATHNADSHVVSVNMERISEVRRFLFATGCHGAGEGAVLARFPGKLAWIAVVLFVLSVLIAVIG